MSDKNFRLSCVIPALAAVLLIFTIIPSFAATDWEKLQPSIAGSPSVKEISKCLECHEEYIEKFKSTLHSKISEQNGNIVCEACHGPTGKHLNSPRKKELIISLKPDSSLSASQRNSICMSCHEKGLRMHWKGNPHDLSGVACSDCHYISERRSMKNLFAAKNLSDVCAKCHAERRAQLMRSSHMPLREGKMDCASCHNPHGGPGPKLLKTASVNETCYECHQEKRGPMLWEHPPVRENCSNCHDPHGSNNPTLLKTKQPYLCQQCHSATFHPSTIYDGTKIPGGGGTTAQQLLGKGCLNCHSQIHGSNHPSGARLQR